MRKFIINPRANNRSTSIHLCVIKETSPTMLTNRCSNRKKPLTRIKEGNHQIISNKWMKNTEIDLRDLSKCIKSNLNKIIENSMKSKK